MKIRTLRTDEIVQQYAAHELLAVVEPEPSSVTSGLIDFIHKHGGAIREELKSRGGLLFRGFGVSSVGEFEQALKTMGLELASDYDFGLTRRTQVSERIFTSTDFNRHLMIPPHTEMAYSHVRPSWISFYCHKPPERFGETPCFDMAGVFRDLPEDLRERFVDGKISYLRQIPAKNGLFKLGRTIGATFGTTDREAIRRKALELGIETRWPKPDLLETVTTLPPVIAHPSTGHHCLNAVFVDHFGQACMFEQFKDRYSSIERALIKMLLRAARRSKSAYANRTLVGDRPLSAKEIRQLFDAFFANSTIFRWRQGDVLLLDNVRTGHARLAFKGKRQIFASFGDAYDTRLATNARIVD